MHADVKLNPTDNLSSQGQNTGGIMALSKWVNPNFRFDANSVPDNIESATLRIYHIGGISKTTMYVNAAKHDNWSENDINSLPNQVFPHITPDQQLASAEATISANVEFDVTEYETNELLGDNIISFELSNNYNRSNSVSSKEGQHSTELVITQLAPPLATQYNGTVYSPPAPNRPDHKFRMNVAITNDSYNDPIKFPYQAGRSHHHLYLGNGYISR